MPIISVKKAFPFAVDGNQVVEIQTGEQEVSERCALVAVEHLGVAEYLDGSGPPESDPLKMKVPEPEGMADGQRHRFRAGREEGRTAGPGAEQ